MIKLRISAAVLALTAAGFAGSAFAQQAPVTDPSAQTTTPPASSTAPPAQDPSWSVTPPSQANSATTNGTPSSATAADAPNDAAAPADQAKPEKKAKKHQKSVGGEPPVAPDTSSDAPK